MRWDFVICYSLLHNETRYPFFALGQTYQLLLQVEVPENDVNTKVGLFMMSVDLFLKEVVLCHPVIEFCQFLEIPQKLVGQ